MRINEIEKPRTVELTNLISAKEENNPDLDLENGPSYNKISSSSSQLHWIGKHELYDEVV